MEKSVLSVLCDFLRNPVITVRVSQAEEIEELKQRCEWLQGELVRTQIAYQTECEFSLRYRDKLIANGISVN